MTKNKLVRKLDSMRLELEGKRDTIKYLMKNAEVDLDVHYILREYYHDIKKVEESTILIQKNVILGGTMSKIWKEDTEQ